MKIQANSSFIKQLSSIISYLSILNFLFFINLFFHSQLYVYGQMVRSDIIELNDSLSQIKDTTPIDSHPDLIVPLFKVIDKDTIELGPNDELIYDQYTALGKPGVYDALHSFNYRRSDRFGGYINDKVNAGLERIRQKGFKSDIKKLYIQVDPLTLTVYWFAIVGPSQDGFSYVRMDSRGSAGGYLRAVQKQLPRMHKLYPDLKPVKFLEFNQDVIVCYTWDGKMLDNYCSTLNIQQHFYKYRKKYDDEKSLKSESLIDAIFHEEEKKDTLISKQSQASDSSLVQKKIINVSKVNEQKVIPKKKPAARYYKVKSGDTLSEIAEKYHSSVAKIKKTNNLKSDKLRIGQLLKIP